MYSSSACPERPLNKRAFGVSQSLLVILFKDGYTNADLVCTVHKYLANTVLDS